VFFKDDESSIIDEENSQLSIKPIPKPPAGRSQFANLHLKLKLKESVYKSYRVKFTIILI
jgi:hypothetical protein